jgi:serine/threonine protein kinase
MNGSDTGGPDDVPARFQVDFTGRLLLGVYHVERRLADGGMGSVYLAQDTNLGRRVVVKVPHARFLGEPGFRARFRREIEELVRLEHPHVVRILARGEEDGVPFFVLQYLGGGSLEDRLARGTQTPADAAAWLEPIARTLDFVHARGVVHRDVKPANILFDEEGHVFLSDFGVVKALGKDDGADLTAVGTGIGSPVYMAPEQSIGRAVSAASDQYALASTLYESLLGVPPFGKASVVEVLVRKGREEAVPLRSLLTDLPAACDAAVARSLTREPAGRFPSCGALAEAFRAGIVRPPAARRSPTPVLMATALFALAVVVAAFTRGFGLWSADDETPPRETPTVPTPAAVVQEPSLLVRVLEQGAEPRIRLRRSFTSGSREARHLRLAQRLSQQLGSKDPIVLAGVTEQALEAEVSAVDEAGTARLLWSLQPGIPLLEGGATPESVAMEKRISDAMGVISGASRMSAAGAVLEVAVSSEKESAEQEFSLLARYKELIRDLAVPLPDIPVGRGATWEVTQIKSAFLMRYQQTYTYEVLELEGRRLRLKFRFSQDAPKQGLSMPVVPEEAKATVLSLTATGGGEYVLDLERAVPVTCSSKGSVSYVMEAPGEPDSPFRFEQTYEASVSER